MTGSDFPRHQVAEKCTSEYKSIAKKKKISLEATGDILNNKAVSKGCKGIEKEYSLCHKSFMGTGSYKGKRHCGEELMALYQCVLQQTN